MTARTTDPATSHLAATYIAGKRPALKDAFLTALKTRGPSTANEIANWCVQHGIAANAESVRKRALELVRDGYCEWDDARHCKVTGLQARTVRLKDAVSTPKPPEERQSESQADTRATSRDSQKRRDDRSTGETIQRGSNNDPANPAEVRLKAAVEFMQQEREFIEDWRVALELSKLAAAGNWPPGSSEDYQQALTAASSRGLIERSGGKVRRKRVEKESKLVQGSLFGD